MSLQLSPYRLGKARDVYNYFNVFNALSWNLLVGSIITLFAMRLGASSTYIGLVNAMVYVSYFFLPLGKVLARRFSIISIYGFAWTWRAICMLLVVAAPIAEYAGRRDVALLLTILGVFAFHFFRGIGMIGNNPVLSALAAGPDRGSYLTQVQIVNSAVTMFGSFLVAMALGREPPIYLYSILLASGVVCGVVSGSLVKKVPEPPGEENREKIRLIAVFKDALSQSGLRLFTLIFFLVAMVSGVVRAFVVVYAREVFAHNDGMVSLYTVFGGLGYLMIGLFIKFLVDRIGAKPIFIVCVIIGLASMIPTIFFPRAAVDNMTGAILFLSFLFFMLNFAFLGSEGIAQTYFLGLIPKEKMLDLGILYFLIFGVAGAGGSFFAGILLDMLSGIGISPFMSFKILFAIQIALTVIALLLQKKLTPLESLPLKGALEVIFSFRDLKAISLLDRLNKTQDSREEELLLGALHDTPSQLAVKGLLERARSPRLVTRLESIRALETLKALSGDAEKALINDIINNPFTTAYISARILGNHQCFAALPLLRELVSSSDYMLAGEAVIALAKLHDEAFRPQIEQIILSTANPRLKIMGVEALGMYRSPNSLSVLLDILRVADPPPYLRDEVVLAMSAILNTQNQFYSILVRYVADPNLLIMLAMDEAESAFEFYHSNMGGKKRSRKNPELAHIARQAKNIQAAVSAFMLDKNGALLSRWILELPDGFCQNRSIEQTILSEAVLDNELSTLNRLRLLIVHWAAYQLRVWTKKFK
ncbi:MAG: MFS transporter [Treponema sp.]|jgi:MFS family permease|nr:MFS transporter [Treponema sp.]